MTALTVEAAGTVQYLKAKLHKEMGYPPEQQRLIFGGEHLEDGRTLSSYNIHKGAIIYISFKVSAFLHSL